MLVHCSSDRTWLNQPSSAKSSNEGLCLMAIVILYVSTVHACCASPCTTIGLAKVTPGTNLNVAKSDDMRVRERYGLPTTP